MRYAQSAIKKSRCVLDHFEAHNPYFGVAVKNACLSSGRKRCHHPKTIFVHFFEHFPLVWEADAPLPLHRRVIKPCHRTSGHLRGCVGVVLLHVCFSILDVHFLGGFFGLDTWLSSRVVRPARRCLENGNFPHAR